MFFNIFTKFGRVNDDELSELGLIQFVLRHTGVLMSVDGAFNYIEEHVGEVVGS